MSKLEELIASIDNQDETKFGELVSNTESLSAELKDLISNSNRVTELLNEIELIKKGTKVSTGDMRALEQEIIRLNNVLDSNSKFNIKLPIIDNSIKFKCDKVIVIKEIKTAIYMNSLIEYLSKAYMVDYKFSNKISLVIVFDDLSNEFRMSKYKKHGFPINKLEVDNPILITNQSLSELKNYVLFEGYDRVIIIDRLGKKDSVVTNDKSDTYYLIDSPSDKTDFNLNTKKCIGFYEPDGITGYNISPSVKVMSFSEDSRAGLIADCQFVDRILCG